MVYEKRCPSGHPNGGYSCTPPHERQAETLSNQQVALKNQDKDTIAQKISIYFTRPQQHRHAQHTTSAHVKIAGCNRYGTLFKCTQTTYRLGSEVTLEALRQDAPPKLTLIRYEIIVDSPETDQRLDLLHRNILKYGTISNTLSAAVPIEGTLRRKL
jgi:hypothetical protein